MTDHLEPTLSDEWAVHKLAHRYAIALDRSDFDAWASLFTEDVVWQTVGRPAFHGLAEVMEVPKRLHAVYKNTFHSVLTQHADVKSTSAEGETYCVAHHMFDYNFVSQGRDPVGLSYNYLIRYHDRFRKTDGIWKYSERILVMVSRQVDQIIQFETETPAIIA